MERLKRKVSSDGGTGPKFLVPPSKLQFIHSGCTLLDHVATGGARGSWPLGRTSNIVGDKSTGKSLLAIEAMANFNLQFPLKEFPKSRIWYREVESAFEEGYAASLGMPERVNFGKEKLDTIEDFYDDLQAKCDWAIANSSPAGLYILDSLDALSDMKEMERGISENTMAMNKAKQLSVMFRKLIRKLEKANIHLSIISQVRDNIGVTFGRKTKRSGGKALDFYASSVIYLAHIETLYQTKRGQKRAIGVSIRAKCDKNKIGPPFRQCDFNIRFGFGIDDLAASVDWLKEIKYIKPKEADDILVGADSLSDAQYRTLLTDIQAQVAVAWPEIESEFLPKRSKYAQT